MTIVLTVYQVILVTMVAILVAIVTIELCVLAPLIDQSPIVTMVTSISTSQSLNDKYKFTCKLGRLMKL